MITGQIVTQDDLNDEIPSVFKITSISFKSLRSDQFRIDNKTRINLLQECTLVV